MKNDTNPVQVILYEGNGATSWDPAMRRSVTSALLDQGYSVRRVSESTNQQSTGNTPKSTSVIVLGQFSETAPEVVDPNGNLKIQTKNTTGQDSDGVINLVSEARTGLEAGLNQPGTNGSWKPWFPVIDYDRCTNCMQCLSFCLFDVYGVDEEKTIQVQNNDNCKTNCPACSRVCPEVAIMFPKYASGPINGEPVKQADLERESMKVDITSLLGGDIYSSLRTRNEKAQSRFSKERSPDKALNERKRCLTKLQQSGIIPAEVLAELDLESLPSAEAIQQKAKDLANLRAEQG
tara:strand:- start:8441 stop:9316 length:876 start_codon:yes stop_codon:yes gene_type:complete